MTERKHVAENNARPGGPVKIADSISYYDRNAKAYFERTSSASMRSTEAWLHFVAELPRVRGGARVLDAGCGSGRDTLAFRNAGYDVTAFDGSPEMARLATEHSGVLVHTLTFEQITWSQQFDGIWACASLVHLPDTDMALALGRLARALKHGGSLYVCAKNGDAPYNDAQGRFFNPKTMVTLLPMLEALGVGLSVARAWCSDSVIGSGDRWINAIARRQS